jgi:adenosylcobinamide-phosphate synthase
MGFIALILALMLEQGRELPRQNSVYEALRRLAQAVPHWTDAGRAEHAWIGWLVFIVPVLGLLILVDWLFSWLHPLATFFLHVAVLYLTVGFRQFSHGFSEILAAFEGKAREDGSIRNPESILRRWLDERPVGLEITPSEPNAICRVSIAHALIASHRHVFAPLLWYILLPGVIGPVLYRLAEMLSRHWQPQLAAIPVHFANFAKRAYWFIDWIPLRLTAAGFAVVGNFEDAVYCWRGALSAGLGEDQRSLLLATGGGALGVNLADPSMEAAWAGQGFEWQGVPADPQSLRSAVGMVWRAVVLWVGVFALLTLASWLGMR